MYLGNLSFDLLQKYLDMLVNYGLIQVQNSNELTYVATEKGCQFLEEFSELRKHSEIAENKKRFLERSLAPGPEKF